MRLGFGFGIDRSKGFTGPRELFTGGIEGVFLDVSRDYRYQDAAGTTLATADTDPLGLSYDLKNGVPVLGAPLTLLATTAAKTTDGTTTVNLLATSAVVGKAVRVQFTVASITGSFTVSSTGTSGTSVTISATGSYDIVVMAGATGGHINIEGLTTSRFDVTDIVIRELPGNHAYQVTTTARFLLASNPKRAVSDNLDDNLNIYFSGGLTDATIVREYTGIGYQLDSGRTVSANHVINTDFSRYIVRQGSLTAAEQAALEAYLGNNRKFMILKSADTTINNLRIYSGGAGTNVLFVGANGATVVKTLTLSSNTNYDVSSDGLTAPVIVAIDMLSTMTEDLNIFTNGLSGYFPSLSTLPNLKSIRLQANNIMGCLPDFSGNPLMTVMLANSNSLTGQVNDFTNNTGLLNLSLHTNYFSGAVPQFLNNVNLTQVFLHTNAFSGAIPSIAHLTKLSQYYVNTNQLSGNIPNMTHNVVLSIGYFNTNQLTGWEGGTVPATLGNFQAQNNLLPQSAVDGLLAAFVAAGKATGTRILNLGGTGNAAPSAAGLADKAILESRGWTVTTN